MRNRPVVTPAVGVTTTAAMSSESTFGLGRHALDQAARGRVVADLGQQLGEALAPEDALGRARLDQPVGEQRGDGARHQRHRRLAQAGADAHADRRRGGRRDRLVRLRADDDRRRVAGAGVGERARVGVVHREQDGGEVAAQVVVDHAAGDLQRDARLEARLEVGAQRVAHEGGAGERAAAVAGHVAEDEADASARQREHVVEVAAGAGAVGGPVGHRGEQRADLVGHRREQRGLEQADLLEQLAPLARQSPRAQRRQQVADAEHDRQRRQRGERGLELVGHDLHQPVDRVGHDVRALVRPVCRRCRSCHLKIRRRPPGSAGRTEARRAGCRPGARRRRPRRRCARSRRRSRLRSRTPRCGGRPSYRRASPCRPRCRARCRAGRAWCPHPSHPGTTTARARLPVPGGSVSCGSEFGSGAGSSGLGSSTSGSSLLPPLGGGVVSSPP